MNNEREIALRLAHEAEQKEGMAPPAQVVARAQVYLDFLMGSRGAENSIAAMEALRPHRIPEPQ